MHAAVEPRVRSKLILISNDDNYHSEFWLGRRCYPSSLLEFCWKLLFAGMEDLLGEGGQLKQIMHSVISLAPWLATGHCAGYPSRYV